MKKFVLPAVFVSLIVLFGYYLSVELASCSRPGCDSFHTLHSKLQSTLDEHDTTTEDLFRSISFQGEEEDVLVFLHIQKTGGSTMERHLVRHVEEYPCDCVPERKRCSCKVGPDNKIWLFSRFSTGWSCGLHADWTELHECVDSSMDDKEGFRRHRSYHYMTMLREPVSRYLSEWAHVRRGATWSGAQLRCNGRPASTEEVPFCYRGETWEGVPLSEFTACDTNLANNRQTRMLANLSLVNCYDRPPQISASSRFLIHFSSLHSSVGEFPAFERLTAGLAFNNLHLFHTSAQSESARNSVLLDSAKRNLRELAFFGLIEHLELTQKLFKATFNLHLVTDLVQKEETRSSRLLLSQDQLITVSAVNQLDIELYKYAETLFFRRVNSTLHGQQDR